MPGYYFNLPQITDLTTVQQVALDEPNPIAISGGPGTGGRPERCRTSLLNHPFPPLSGEGFFLVNYCKFPVKSCN